MAPQYSADDLDDLSEDYTEDEPLSAEDKDALIKGTAEVKKELGVNDSKQVTVKQIEDALWHYFYDVDKSVGYLRKTFVASSSKQAPKPAPKKPPEGTSSAVFFHAAYDIYDGNRLSMGHTGADPGRIPSSSFRDDTLESLSLASSSATFDNNSNPRYFDFSDMPWFNIPRERQTVFLEPSLPRGGLLGGGEGAPKMSKLQALAAARKQKIDEKKEQDTTQSVKDIQKLSISDSSRKENRQPVSNSAKRQKTTAKPSPRPQNARPSSPLNHKPEDLQSTVCDNAVDVAQPAAATPAFHHEQQTQEEAMQLLSQKANPSEVARTLFGSAPENTKIQQPDVYAMPYTISSSYVASAFSEPSPDDIVLEAQARAGKNITTAPKAPKKAPKDKESSQDSDLSQSISSLKVSDVPSPKSRGLDVIKEFENSNSKRSASFVVVGHVDAGKSTLMGRLLLEMKCVEERTIERYRTLAEKSGKQSFALAWVMDQRPDEREHGVTIDIATERFETPKTKFTILDAPGHQDYVPNMIAGASQADFAILVIDANTGAYEKGLKGQTREHVLLLRSLGVLRLIVAVNKLDMVDWSQARFDEITQQLTGFLTGLDFRSTNIRFVPISGLSGVNVTQKMEDPAASWYTGKTLMDELEASEVTATRRLNKPFRMGVSDVYRSQQGNTTLVGRIDSGTAQVGDAVLVQPSGETASIKSFMVDNASQDWAVAGQNITVALNDIDVAHIRDGDILCHTTDPIECGDTFTMKAMAFSHLYPKPVELHRGRLNAAGYIQSMPATLDKRTGEILKRRPQIVQPGAVARVVIKLYAKIPLESGQRVVIRSAGETIAAGLLE